MTYRVDRAIIRVIDSVESRGYVVARIEFDWLTRKHVTAVEFKKVVE